jgi:hypothetical protein
MNFQVRCVAATYYFLLEYLHFAINLSYLTISFHTMLSFSLVSAMFNNEHKITESGILLKNE